LYLYLALFWLSVGVTVQVFWEPISQHAMIPVSRTMMGAIFFILFCYNFVRWRMGRVLNQIKRDAEEPPRRRTHPNAEYDPTLDFSKPDDKPPP
jgi:hypothetical protein